MSMDWTMIGMTTATAKLATLDDRVMEALSGAMENIVLMGEGIVKGKASGPPGPNVRSGNYVGSINGKTEPDAEGIIGRIGTNAPQGARLEWGFKGPDVLGRVYNQKERPHWRPAAEELKPYAIKTIKTRLEAEL